MNRYLEERANRRKMMRDGRNPYGSRGGYVTSRKGRGRDREMGYDYPYSERDSRFIDRNVPYYGREDYHMGYEQYGEHPRHTQYEMYGVGGIRPMEERHQGHHYHHDYMPYDYASEDEEWERHLKKWCEELKKHDRFNMPKEQVINQARQMKIKFDNYSDDEFYTTYLMKISDDEDNLISNPQMAIIMAKNFLEDKDSMLKGSEKLCAYYYEVIKGGEDD